MPSIEALLGHSADDIEKMSDEDLFKAFPDVFNFEKSLRENVSLLTPDKSSSKSDPDESEISLGTTTTNSVPKKIALKKSRAEEKRQAMMELLTLAKSMGVPLPTSNKPKTT